MSKPYTSARIFITGTFPGPNFISLHKLLSDYYADLIDEKDQVAERLLKCGIPKIPADYGTPASTISPPVMSGWMDMLADLVYLHRVAIASIGVAVAQVTDDDQATMSALGEWQNIHETQILMLSKPLTNG